MTIEQLKKIHASRPFKPFTVHVADGRAFAVPHPEFLSFSQSGRTIAIATPDDAHEIIDPLLVTSIHLGNGRKPGGNGRQKRS